MTSNPITPAIPSFDTLSGVAKILAIGWHLHAREHQAAFTADDIRNRFRAACFEPPDLSIYLPRLVAKKPPQMVKTKGGYRLDRDVMRRLDAKYGETRQTVAVSTILAKLPSQVPNIAERTFLDEALNCYQIKAYRASIVMVWSLAFDHFCSWVLSDGPRLDAFNNELKNKYPKKYPIKLRTDFDELREKDIIEVGRAAKVLPKNVGAILSEKLGRRNIAAHPSSVTITQAQADDIITDLVNNVVLGLT